MNKTQRGNLAWSMWFVGLWVTSIVQQDPVWWRVVISILMIIRLLAFVYEEGEG